MYDALNYEMFWLARLYALERYVGCNVTVKPITAQNVNGRIGSISPEPQCYHILENTATSCEDR